jgi:hypothetical protein
MTPEEESIRADRAKELLENPLVIEAFETIEREITQALMDSPARDTEGREKLYLMNQLLKRVKKHFESTVNTGYLAKRTIADRLKKQAI